MTDLRVLTALLALCEARESLGSVKRCMKTKQDFLTLGGAIAGGVVGYFVFIWLAHQGLYAMVVPGGLAGLGGGILKTKSPVTAALCGVVGLAAGIYTEFRLWPFASDPSLGYFLSHLHQLKPITMIMIAVGAFIAFWMPWDRQRTAA